MLQGKDFIPSPAAMVANAYGSAFIDSSPVNIPWLHDSGATHNFTGDASNLADTKNPFLETDVVIVVSYSLMSIQRLCWDNNVIVEFHANCVFIKMALSKAALAKGRASGGLYSLDGQLLKWR